MQFLPSLVVYKDVWGTSTVLVLNIDWQSGWLLGWHALEGGSPRVGGVVRLETEIKPGDSGRLLSVACGARTLWFLGISFCHCRFSCDLNWCMASLALVCGLAKVMVPSHWGETVLWPPQEHLDWPDRSSHSRKITDKRQLSLKRKVLVQVYFPVACLRPPATLASCISLCNLFEFFLVLAFASRQRAAAAAVYLLSFLNLTSAEDS